MEKPLFTGVCTAMVTPFLNGQVNYPMMELLLKRQIDAGIEAVVIAGTTGEAPTLSDAEKIELFRRCKAYAGKHCKIIAGTGSNDTLHAIALSQAAQAVGVDGLLVVSPYYNKATAEGLYAHYAAIAAGVELPIILYNVPSRTGLDIPVEVYTELQNLPNIVGVKEASTDIKKVMQIRKQCGKDFSLWTGNDELTVAAMALGAKGIISVVSNLYPRETQEMAKACLAGDFQEASSILYRMLPILECMSCEVNPIPVKAGMHCIGYDCGDCRLPLTPISQEKRRKLSALLK